jgi:hypothetical protein
MRLALTRFPHASNSRTILRDLASPICDARRHRWPNSECWVDAVEVVEDAVEVLKNEMHRNRCDVIRQFSLKRQWSLA